MSDITNLFTVQQIKIMLANVRPKTARQHSRRLCGDESNHLTSQPRNSLRTDIDGGTLFTTWAAGARGHGHRRLGTKSSSINHIAVWHTSSL